MGLNPGSVGHNLRAALLSLGFSGFRGYVTLKPVFGC